ncbi:MAG: hypothetical protein U0572_06345 [Phycisphaerales bacterium]
MASSRRRSVTGLIILNAALLVALGAVTLAPRANAQARVRSTYTMVAGAVNGQTPAAVYIVDESGQELVGVTWDDNRRQLVGMGFRNLAADAGEIGRTRN